jgi:ankyrin repeat protein
MKALFTEIRAGDVDAVLHRLDVDPSLVATVAKAPPKKDDGQSPLQVAIKSGCFAVAHALLDRGAEVNFMDVSPLNPWHMPVLHDAIRAAVFSTRFERNRALPGNPANMETMNTGERSDEAFAVLLRLILLGADANATDSYGNSPLGRAALDTRQIISEPLPVALHHDLERIFATLLEAGADPVRADPRSGRSVTEILGASAVWLVPGPS